MRANLEAGSGNEHQQLSEALRGVSEENSSSRNRLIRRVAMGEVRGAWRDFGWLRISMRRMLGGPSA